MRKRLSGWLALLAAASVAAALPAAASQPDPARPEPVRVTSFSGAFLAARVAEADNDLVSAIDYYKKALAFDPENIGLQQSLMLALISRGRFDEALPYADKLKTAAEVERFSRLALAVDSLRKKEYGQVDYWMKLALSSDLDTLITALVSAWGKVGEGKGAQAVAALDGLKGPEWYRLFLSYHKGLIADAAGLADVARKNYRAASEDVTAGSAAPETWLRAVEAYAGYLSRTGKKQEALAVIDKAGQMATGSLPLTQLRARIESGAAIAPMAGSPTDGAAEALLNLATALNRGGGEPFVQLYLQYALALKPDSDVALVQLAAVAEQQQDAQGAIDLYRRVPADSPLKRASDLQMGLNLADLDKRDEAIAELRRLIDAEPGDMRAYLALGGVYASKEDYRGAATVYDEAVARLESAGQKASSADWNIWYQRGIAYERLKEWPKAEPNFRKALEINPEQPQVLNYLGYSWVDMNMNLDEGMDMIRRAVELRPSDGYIVDSLGWAHYRLGQYDEAVTELERAVSLKPDDPVLNDHLGDAYWRVGRKLEATFQWAHARDLKPDDAVMESVRRKLVEGLPPVEDSKAAAMPAPASAIPAPAPAVPAPAETPRPAPNQRSDTPTVIAPVVPASYTVQKGQSLWSIAADALGNGNRYIEILDLNPELRGNPGRIRPGQELRLPAGN
ncbi:MAG: tetratricopeptide repeat protein [Rhizobiaceae bacterium]